MREFVSDFITEPTPSSSPSGEGQPSVHFPDPPHTPSNERKPKIRDFSRVTLCKPSWPDLSHHRSHREACELFSETFKGIKRAVKYLKAEDLPFAKFAAFVSRWGGGN